MVDELLALKLSPLIKSESVEETKTSNGGDENELTLKEKIQDDIQNNKVVVYSKSYCPYCKKTKKLLEEAGVDAKIFELDQLGEGSKIQNTLKEITSQSTVPNIFIGGVHIGGN